MERHSWDQYSDSYGTFGEVSETRILLEFHTFLLLLYIATWLRHNMKATLFIALKAGSRRPEARPKCLCGGMCNTVRKGTKNF